MTTAMVVLTEAQARTLTARIRASGEQLASLLLEAHDAEAWKAMGYKSWNAYIDGEFDFKRSRSYQLLGQAKVNRTLAEAGSDVRVSEREAREVSTKVDVQEIEGAVIDRRVAAYEKPRNRSRGFAAPEDKVRQIAELLESWCDLVDEHAAIPATLRRQFERVYDAAGTLKSLPEPEPVDDAWES